jgi:hypothetical protein
MIKINDRTPFHLVSTIFLFITIVLSMASTFTSTKNFSDFFPTPITYQGKWFHDESIIDKICWYFSQITHHTLFLLFAYFLMALFNKRSEVYFKMVAPLALTVSVLYFYFLYPRQSLAIHQLPFYNFFSHFMIIFLVFGEYLYIKSYDFKETTYCFIFVLTALLAVYINYVLRGVWSYNLIKLDRFGGWKLVSEAIIIMYIFSFMFSCFKNKHLPWCGMTMSKIRSGYNIIVGIINILIFLFFTVYDHNY